LTESAVKVLTNTSQLICYKLREYIIDRSCMAVDRIIAELG